MHESLVAEAVHLSVLKLFEGRHCFGSAPAKTSCNGILWL